jgi:hypothetical protein
VHQLPPKDIWEITEEAFGRIRRGQTLDEIVATFGEYTLRKLLVAGEAIHWDRFAMDLVSGSVFDVEVTDLGSITPVFLGVPLRGTVTSLQKVFREKHGIEFREGDIGGFSITDRVSIWNPPGLKRIATVCVRLGNQVVRPGDFLPLPSKK